MIREISKEVYDEAVLHHGYIQDRSKVFTPAECFGYGIYNDRVFERDGKYYVNFEMGESCD